MATNNDNIDNNLDEQIDDVNIFDDFDPGQPAVKGRNPSGPGRVVIKNLLSASSAFTKTAAAEIEQSMPKTSGLMGEFVEIKDALSEFKQEFREQYAPTINEVRKAMYKSLPMAERYIPKQLYDRIEKALEGYKGEVREAQKTDEQRQSEKISASIAEIFAAQEEIRAGERTEDRVNDMVEKVTASTRHAETKKLLTSISNSLYYQSNFIKTTQTAWMKKMLELKYISVYTQRESLNTLKVQASMLETKLEELKHNNAIPDWQKWTLVDHKDRLKKQFIVGKAMQAAPTIKGYIGQVGKNLIGTAKQSTRGILQGIRSQAAMAGTAADMASMMPDEPQGIGTGIGKAIGGIGGWWGGKKLADKVRPFIDTIEEESQSLRDTAFFRSKRLKERLEGKGSVGASFLASFLPTYTESMNVDNELLSNPTQPLPFDRATRQAIVEVIPAYLSKIAKYTRDTATGRSNEEEVYDIVTRKMTSKSQALESAKGQVFGKQGARSQDTLTAIGKVRAGFERNVGAGVDVAQFDKLGPQILKFMNNSAIRNEIIYPDMIRRFSEGDPEASSSEYIRKTFAGIQNPKEVATAITMSIYGADGKVDRKVLRQIESSMVRAASAKSWRERLPQMLEGQGAYSMFKESDLISDEGVISEEELSSLMTDVSEEQVQKQSRDIGESTYSDLARREAQEQALSEEAAKKWKKTKYVAGKVGQVTGGVGRGIAWAGRGLGKPLSWAGRGMSKAYGGITGKYADNVSIALDKAMRAHIAKSRSEDELPPSGQESEGMDNTLYYDNFVNFSKKAASSPISRDAVEAIVSFRDSSEEASKQQLAKLAELCQYQKSLEEKITDAFTHTEDKTGSLGPKDLFEKMQLDINTLVESTISNNERMYTKVEDLLAAAELSLEMAQKRTTDLDKLVVMTDKRMPKSTFGDTDMDNIREGSYADQMKDKAAKGGLFGLGAAFGRGGGSKSDKQRQDGEEGEEGTDWANYLQYGALALPLLFESGREGIKKVAEKATGIGKMINVGQRVGLRGLNMLKASKAGQLFNLGRAGKLGKVGQTAFNVGKGALKLVPRAGGALSRLMLPGFVRGAGRFGGKALSLGGKALGKSASALGRAAGPITALAEIAYGAGKTGFDDEASEAHMQDMISRQRAIEERMGIFGTLGKYTGTNQAIMALGLDKYGQNWKEKGAVKGTLANAWESLGVFGKLGSNIGTAVNRSIDTVKEFKGPRGYSELLDALKAQGIVEDPWGWGDWNVLDWNAIGKLSSADLGVLYGQGSKHFSDETLDTVKSLWQAKVKKEMARKRKQKEAAEVAKAAKKVTEPPQKAKTVTQEDGKTVADNYQSPAKQEQMQKEQVKEAVATMSTANQEMTMELIRETRETNMKQQQVIDALMGIKDNTGKLEDIDGKMKESVEQGKNPKVVVAPVDATKAQPKVHRPSVKVAQEVPVR